MLDKRFNFSEVEAKCLNHWSENKIFSFNNDESKKPFCIMMPPPNVTGSLHMGHALTFTLQDILIRFHKKLNKNVLWQPGTDHAGIATEIVVEKMIQKESELSKVELGRSKFIEKIWNWKEESGDKIINQMKRLGTSVDWNVSRFTMDEGLSDSVKEVFIDLYNRGLIYKDKRLVNWDPKLGTALSDLEVNQIEKVGKMWFIKYQLENSKENIVIGTTRPETIFGDSGIAIHPKNKKLNHLIGKKALIPILNKSIPIFADEYADPEKGSGAVKITPAHDFNDFEIGKKHDLEFVNILDKTANLNKNTPKEYQGLNRFVARKKLISELKKQNKILKIVNNKMFLPMGDRSDEVIEPLLTFQWFLDTKKISIKVKKAIKEKKIVFHPNSWINTFKYWIENIEPWCISRQIWWGHRIPIWYSNKGLKVAAKSKEEAVDILKLKDETDKILHQDEDVLDTWFSSALWPFSTLGWPENNKLLKTFYPSNVLVTGFDIIFFWVARMVMMGLEFMNEVPFKNIYIHPLVKDENGQKMSKSKGNVIDPLDLIEKYGSDALRFTLTNLSTQGRDIKLSDKLVENSRNFITKIWNVARFSQFNNFKYEKEFYPQYCALPVNNWILSRFFETQNKVIRNLENFKFNLMISELYQFIWSDFCDFYIELSKNYLKEDKNKKEISNVFNFVFSRSLNLINPVIPFITEKLGKELGFIQDSFFETKLHVDLKFKFKSKEIDDFKKFIELIKKIRFEIGNNKSRFSLYILSEEKVMWIDKNIFLLTSIFKFESVEYEKKIINKTKHSKILVIFGLKFIIVPSGDSKFKDQKSLSKKILFYENEINFFNEKLKNSEFLNKAPSKIIDQHKFKLEEAKRNLKLLTQK